MMDGIGRDVRFAARGLRRNPGFTLAALAVLGLGIGAVTAIFGAANAYFFRPLPFGEADRLVHLYESNPEFGWTHQTAAPANALDWRDEVDAFQDLALFSSFVGRVTLLREGDPRLLGATEVSGNFFEVLGVQPALGRGFRWEETWAEGREWGEGREGVVLSHDAWVELFGADPEAVGATLPINGRTAVVLGVMPEGFGYPSPETDLWSTFGWERSTRDATWFRRAHWLRPVARLAPGATVEEADAQLQVVVERLQEAYPETNRVMGAGLMPLRAFLIRDVRRSLTILLGAVGLLLVLASINVANLVLVRAADRAREVAVRYAMGAGRRSVLRLFLSESVLLALGGAALGLALGWVGLRWIGRLSPLGIQGATGAVLDHRVVLFAGASAALSLLVFGLAPALRSLGGGLEEALREGGRAGSPGRTALRGVRGLVVAEVALALVLVVAAGLMVRSFTLLRSVDPGFTAEGTLAVTFSIPEARYSARDDVLAFYDRFLESVEARPGIERAGLVQALPLAGWSWTSQFQAEGWPPERVGHEVIHRRADRGYFEALEIPLVRGRFPGPDDRADDPWVVVVNEAFAREHFPGEDPIGQRIAFDRAAAADPDDHRWLEVVGIVGDQHQASPGEPVAPEVFESAWQDWGRSNWVVLRTDGEPLAAVPAVRAVLREMDPLIPLAQVRPLRQVWRASMEREEMILSLLTVFGVVALLLATVGVYGVTAQMARMRTREIGIRMALGAGGGDVLGMVLRQSLGLVALGLALGLAVALAGTGVLADLLYGVEPDDPRTLGAVVALLAAAGVAACWFPARRATTVDPVRSLKAE